MPAFSVCVCCSIGRNVKTATAIFHGRTTKAAYLWKQRRPGSGLLILLRQHGPCPPDHLSPHGSHFCSIKGIKSKLRPGWQQKLIAVSRDRCDLDYSCFVKLCAKVITRLTEKVQTFLCNREPGCKLFRGDATRPLNVL